MLEQEWTVAFSSQKDMWGAFAYDPKNDVLRVKAKPVAAEPVERMQFTFDDPTDDAVTLNLRWEKLSVPLHITVDTQDRVLTGARVVPCITIQVADGYEVEVMPPWENFPGESIEADTAAVNRFIESQVLRMPEQYFWLHKRFKTRPPGEQRFYK